MENEILKKAPEKGKTGVKKDEKKKDVAKKGGKDKGATEVQEYKVEKLIPVQFDDYSKQNKINYFKIDIENTNSLQIQTNAY